MLRKHDTAHQQKISAELLKISVSHINTINYSRFRPFTGHDGP